MPVQTALRRTAAPGDWDPHCALVQLATLAKISIRLRICRGGS